MTTLPRLLDKKGREVISIQATDNVLDAITKMVDRKIGALLVKDGQKPVGILTERHYVKSIVEQGKLALDTPVSELMQKNLVCISMHRSVNECFAVIFKNKVRHLPIVDDNSEIIGILSVSDLAKSVIEEQQFTIEQLEHYIEG